MLNTILTKPTSPFSVYSPKTASIHNTFTKRSFLSLTRRRRVRTFRALKVSSSISSSQEELDTQEEEADARETELFEVGVHEKFKMINGGIVLLDSFFGWSLIKVLEFRQ